MHAVVPWRVEAARPGGSAADPDMTNEVVFVVQTVCGGRCGMLVDGVEWVMDS